MTTEEVQQRPHMRTRLTGFLASAISRRRRSSVPTKAALAPFVGPDGSSYWLLALRGGVAVLADTPDGLEVFSLAVQDVEPKPAPVVARESAREAETTLGPIGVDRSGDSPAEAAGPLNPPLEPAASAE